MGKLPAFQFYPGDWMKDPALRSVSATARGLWIDLLCLMFECPERGVLSHYDGRPFTPEEIARATGIGARTVKRCLAELEHAGVMSLNERNCVVSRRQRVDHEQRLKNNERQMRYYKKQRVTQKSDACLTIDLTPTSHASSSSSTSTSSLRSDVLPPKPPKADRSPLWGELKFFRCSDEEMKIVEAWYRKNHLGLDVRDAVLESCENWLADGNTPVARSARSNPTHYRRLMNREWIARTQSSLGKPRATATGPYRPPGLQVLDREMERERERERNQTIPERPKSLVAIISDRGGQS